MLGSGELFLEESDHRRYLDEHCRHEELFRIKRPHSPLIHFLSSTTTSSKATSPSQKQPQRTHSLTYSTHNNTTIRFSIIAVASAIVATVFAAPVKIAKRDAHSDIGILNFALSLEHLEAEFYKQGLAKYKRADFKHYGYDDKIWERIEHISKHEATHVTFLTAAIESLKGTPLPPCEYKFPLDSLDSFLAVAQALEHTGTSAYLGAASGLEGDLLTAAATITTVEARHASFLSELLGQSGIPYSFDTPLNAREVITLASNFVTSCPFDVPIHPFTQLKATLPKKGDVKVETSFEGEKDIKYWCQFLYNDKVVVSPREECALPATVVGYVYVVITDSSAPISLNDDSTIVAGPALLFYGSHDEY